jgi:Transposase DDE domain
MTEVRSLERTLGETLPWNKARINFSSKFLIALIQVRTVNLVEIANSFAGRAKEESNYKRIQRFLRRFELSYAVIAIFVVQLLGLPKPWVLTIDRTNWQFGKHEINILTMGIAYKGAAFPILWVMLDKKGNSNTRERKAIMEEYIKLFGTASILYLCADREFIGKKWFAYLRRNKIDFRIRIKESTLVPNARGQKRNAWQLFAFTRTEEELILEQPRTIWGMPLYFSGMRLKTGEYLIIASLCYSPTPVDDYAKRWEIETLFGCLKSRGFRLEETHLTDSDRIKKLIALLAIAFCWAHIVGEWLAELKPIKIKKHGRLAKSIFRLGFDKLRRVFTNFEQAVFSMLCSFLSCT